MAKVFMAGDQVIPIAAAEGGAFKRSSPGTIVQQLRDGVYEVRYDCQCGCRMKGERIRMVADILELVGPSSSIYSAELTGLGLGRHVYKFRATSQEEAQAKVDAFMAGKERDNHGYRVSDYLPSCSGKHELLILLSLQEVDN